MKAPVFLCFAALGSSAAGPLTGRVHREVLDQLNPVEVRTSTRGATTLQFPANLQGVEGDGFTAKPDDVPGDFLFSKGPNWVTVKALNPGAQQNLNVVIDGKVYSILLTAGPQNDFAVLFRFAPPGHGLDGARPVPRKEVTPPRLIGLIDKLKGYPTFSALAPAMYIDMDVNEPPPGAATVENARVKARIVRVLRDGGMDALAFEVSLTNKGDAGYAYDPNAFEVRAGKLVFKALTGDAPGTLPPHGQQTAFFVVSGGEASSQPADLSAFNDFQLVLPDPGAPNPS